MIIFLAFMLLCGINYSFAINDHSPDVQDTEQIAFSGMARWIGLDVPVDYIVTTRTMVTFTMSHNKIFTTTATAMYEKIYETDAQLSGFQKQMSQMADRLNDFENRIQRVAKKQDDNEGTVNQLQSSLDKSMNELHQNSKIIQLLSANITTCGKCEGNHEKNLQLTKDVLKNQIEIQTTKNNLQNAKITLTEELKKLQQHVETANKDQMKTITSLCKGDITSTIASTHSNRTRVPITRPPAMISTGTNGNRLTKENLKQYLNQISSSQKISGLYFEDEHNSNIGIQTIHNITGVLPGILSVEMPTFQDDNDTWESFVTKMTEKWNDGYLLHLTWGENPIASMNRLKSSEWRDLIQDGSQLNKKWKQDLDLKVLYLKQLQTAGVVAMIDPFPRLNDDWSNWGGRSGISGSLKLYQKAHDYLTNLKSLNSFLWVWSLSISEEVDLTQLREYWPGENYVDIVSIYMYGQNVLETSLYQQLLGIVGDKPISMESTYDVPPRRTLATQPKILWVTLCNEYVNSINNETLKEFFQGPSAINKANVGFFHNAAS